MNPLIALSACLLFGEPSVPPVSTAAYAQLVERAIADTVAREALARGQGWPLQPGLVLAMNPERLQLFDQAIATFEGQEGCDLECAAMVLTQLRRMWLELVLDSMWIGAEIPSRVHLAATGQFPAASLVAIAYAVAQSRPVSSPDLSLLVELPGRGLRSQPFYLLPPEGLRLQPGTGVLAPVVEIHPDGYRVDSLDAGFSGVSASDLGGLVNIIERMKRKYPGKETLILRPAEQVTLADVLEVVEATRSNFPVVVLGAPA